MSFNDIESQDFIVEYLKRVWKSGRVPHAFMFAGQKGVGKIATALKLAMLKFCDAPDAETCEPCAVCENCCLVINGDHPDMCQLLDDPAEANIKIGDAKDIPPADPYFLNYPRSVREVLYSVERKSARGKGKFIMIQNAEKLTPTAANALLKSIEEPLGETVWVLTTAEAEKNISTIVSRCHILRFGDIPSEEISNHLQSELDMGIEQADYIAGLSNGSISRAEEILEKNLVPVREWFLQEMKDVGNWDTFDFSEKLRQLAPGMVFGFDEQGSPLSAPEGVKANMAPLRKGLQDFIGILLEFLRDLSIDPGKAGLRYQGTIHDDDIVSAEEEAVNAYLDIGRNVNPEIVMDNLLRQVQSHFI